MTSIVQPSFTEIGEPLIETTFVIIDMETTGGRGSGSITEIGAVKTRGGERIGQFQTLVRPDHAIAPMVVSLTGITNAMVEDAPDIGHVLPSLLEFIGDAVLVAHNAPFDIGLLKSACKDHHYPSPKNLVVDTVVMARRATTQEEAPNKKLSTLAALFSTSTTPNHRALADAEATSDVLHALLERLERFGVTHREDLHTLKNQVPEAIRTKAHLADKVPNRPGVYMFRSGTGEVLYIGTSRNLRSRVKSYFTSAEQRRSIRDMLLICEKVDTYVCGTPLEANVLEVRLLQEHRPRYNRRSTRPEKTTWLALTDEAYPRLSLVRVAKHPERAIGPIPRSDAIFLAEQLPPLLALRTCTPKLPLRPTGRHRACILKDLGSCSAPCVSGADSDYPQQAKAAEAVLFQDMKPLVDSIQQRINDLSAELEFENAAKLRNVLSVLAQGLSRTQRMLQLQRCSMVAARRDANDQWEVVSIRHGYLTGSAKVKYGVVAVAQTLIDGWKDEISLAANADMGPSVEEQELILSWLDKPGLRLVKVDGDWSCSVAGAGRFNKWVDARKADQALEASIHS